MPRRSRGDASESVGTTPKRRRRSERFSRSRARRDADLGGTDQNGRHVIMSDIDFLDNNKVLRTIEGGSGTELKAESVDVNLKENRAAHHTDQYEAEELIVRRGETFDLSITFDRAYSKDNDLLIIQFVTGARPVESKGTVIRLHVEEDDSKKDDDWAAWVKNQNDTVLTISIFSAADAIVGRYQIFVETLTRDPEKIYQHRTELDEPVTVIFNPWCQDDQAFMKDEEERNEYVLNECGLIWIGVASKNHGIAWNYGQFEDVSLEAALHLLDKAELRDEARSDPIHIVRCISAMANSNDEDGGVLTGRWTSTYPKNSTAPWSWTGSIGILEEYMKHKKAVRFGQCWVFSGIVTTLCRALGIPTRSVTNFESAHDTDSSMTIDMHWDDDDDPIPEMNDSIWNFHVWNESFFKRPDLPAGFDGWQAFDATPQETSEGVMRCGPVPLKAIKEGDVYIPYDAPFIFAEVNGDRVHWTVAEDGSMKVIIKESSVVGRFIKTKNVGNRWCNDITSLYKYPEGSEEERRAVRRAFRRSSRRQHKVYDAPEPDVTFELLTPEAVAVGSEFSVRVHMKNKVDEPRDVKVKISTVASFYTGVASEKILADTFEETIEPNGEKEVALAVSPEEYDKLLTPESLITVYLRGHVKESNRSYAKIDTFRLVKPDLTLTVPEKVEFDDMVELSIKFTNPLATKLTGGVFHIEAAGLVRSMIVPVKKAIGPGEDITHTVKLTPKRSGSREILVNFTSDQLGRVVGCAEVYIKYPN